MKLRSFLIFIVSALLLFGSCKTPQQRLNRLVDKYPSLLKDSTIIDYDTTIFHVPEVHADSVIHINTIMHDTFILEKERLRIRTYIHKDSIFIEGECLEIIDTVIVREEIPYKYVQQENTTNWKQLLFILLGFVLSLIILKKTKVL